MILKMPCDFINLAGMEKADLKGLDRRELESFARDSGLEPFRGRQIFRWIYQTGASDFEPMSDISKPLKEKLTEIAVISRIQIEKKLLSIDGSTKFLFRLGDGARIESVLIPEVDRVTLCVSSQAGCPAQCRFYTAILVTPS